VVSVWTMCSLGCSKTPFPLLTPLLLLLLLLLLLPLPLFQDLEVGVEDALDDLMIGTFNKRK